MSVGSRRFREGDDKPRDWRDAHLTTPSTSSKRKDGPEDREKDLRGYPRYKPERNGGYRSHRDPGGSRGDSPPHPSYRGRNSDYRSDHRYRQDSSPDRVPKSSSSSDIMSLPSSLLRPNNEEREDGEISPRPEDTSARNGVKTPPLAINEVPEVVSEPQPDLELVIPSSPPLNDLVAARRAKRAAILAKYEAQKTQTFTPVNTISGVGTETRDITVGSRSDSVVLPRAIPSGTSSGNPPAVEKAVSDGQATPVRADEAFSLAKNEDEKEATIALVPSSLPSVANVADLVVDGIAPEEQVSAADYDPSMDRREEDARRARQAAASLADGTGEVPNQVEVTLDDSMQVEDEEDEEGDEDDDFDMFAIPSDKPKKKSKKPRDGAGRIPQPLKLASADTAADPEGYYQIVLGEALDGGRYQVFSSLGKGMFSAVVRARIIHGENIGKEVAIKIIRAQESMYRAGLKEVQILNKLAQADPEDKKHLIRLERTFEHRGHLCLVFESLSMNLREVVKRFGKDVGLNIGAVRAYAYQLFLALSLLKKCNIMHADIKPDNILVNEQKNLLKLCDLGSASDISENDIAPYLVSRFYRAPEIILGLPYDASLDVWSIGCTLYELFTGKILFPGRTNNQMLLHMMEVKGRFNSKMIKKAKFGEVHFDESGLFTSVELDKITGKDVIRKVHITKPKRDLRSRIIPSSGKLKDDEAKVLQSFVDLLDKCLTLDPAKRLTPKEALSHPFVRG